MKNPRVRLLIAAILVIAAAGYAYVQHRPQTQLLTGVVATDDVIVSPQVGGQVTQLLVTEGNAVKKGELLAVIAPAELQADTAYYAQNAAGLSAQVEESEAALRFQQQQTADLIRQAEATLASTEAQAKAASADLENARLIYTRLQNLAEQKLVAPQDLDQARTTFNSSQAKLESLKRQIDAQRASVSLARSNAEQTAQKQSQLQTDRHMQAAAEAQRDKADVRLRYTQITAPIDGVIDVRAVRAGEYVTAGEPMLTIVNPDDLWVRADVEESYIDGVRLGDRLTVRLPSGVEREGTVFFRGVDAAFATQRDVSRTKRDIKTFEIRLRVENRDRALAVGMTAYVLLPARPI